MTEEEIEANAASDPDNAPWTEEELREARTVGAASPRWEVIRLHIDRDLLEWFRQRRFLYQDEINEVLRNYMERHRLQVGTTARTGEVCPESGVWKVIGEDSVTAPIAKGNRMPPYGDRAVTWQLARHA